MWTRQTVRLILTSMEIWDITFFDSSHHFPLISPPLSNCSGSCSFIFFWWWMLTGWAFKKEGGISTLLFSSMETVVSSQSQVHIPQWYCFHYFNCLHSLFCLASWVSFLQMQFRNGNCLEDTKSYLLSFCLVLSLFLLLQDISIQRWCGPCSVNDGWQTRVIEVRSKVRREKNPTHITWRPTYASSFMPDLKPSMCCKEQKHI